MYYFYMTPVAPFLVIAITLVLGEILGKASAGSERRSTGLLVVALYVGVVVANFIWLWPILNGIPITADQLAGRALAAVVAMTRLHELVAVHLAERVGDQLDPGTVGIPEVDRRAALQQVLDAGGLEPLSAPPASSPG